MSAVKLTEAQRAALAHVSGCSEATLNRIGVRGAAKLVRYGLIRVTRSSNLGGCFYTITEAGRAALRGES
jgi:hypothetical protein